MDIAEKKAETIFRHPWEISRADNILALAHKHLNTGPLADIGSGDLYFALRMQSKTVSSIVAVDKAYAQQKPANVAGITYYSDISSLNKDLYGAVFLLDVLEHIENDSDFLYRAGTLLMNNGRLFVTVPAHRFLFSEHDVFLKHERRYSKPMLTQAIKSSGLVAEKVFYFYFSLFFVRLIEVFFGLLGAKSFSKQAVSDWKHPESSFLTGILVGILNADFKICLFLSSLKISLPGLTLCAVCRKISS